MIQVPSHVKIIAASKSQTAEKIRKLYEQGQRVFGENYVQEALDKKKQLEDLNIEWHLIGHLQKNKCKLAVGEFALIHSVDSLSLAETINRYAKSINCVQPILLQINLSHEHSKFGFTEEGLYKNLEKIMQLPNIQVKGLMTFPPPGKGKIYFRRLKEIAKKYPSLIELSMGVSDDYKEAIEEGATMVRLGTILFGGRD